MKFIRVFKFKSYMKALASVVACLLLVSFITRSFVVRPSERIQKLYSILNVSNTPEMNLDDSHDCEYKPAVFIGKRVRDDEPLEANLEYFIIRDLLSNSHWMRQFHRLSITVSQSVPILYSISTIEKPPKV